MIEIGEWVYSNFVILVLSSNRHLKKEFFHECNPSCIEYEWWEILMSCECIHLYMDDFAKNWSVKNLISIFFFNLSRLIWVDPCWSMKSVTRSLGRINSGPGLITMWLMIIFKIWHCLHWPVISVIYKGDFYCIWIDKLSLADFLQTIREKAKELKFFNF